MERVDIAIVGSGPAGLSAALNAKIRNKSFIVFGNNNLSNKVIKASKINNYLGFYGVTGKDLAEKFKEHINSMDIKITEERVNNIYAMGDYFALMVNEKMYEATTVILATGMEYTKPIKGEEQLLGKGVGYCATCDAPIYRGKKVIVIADSPKEEEEVEFLTEVCQEVTYFPLYKEEVAVQKDNLSIVKDIPVSIEGTLKANTLVTKQGTYTADGIFILRQSQFPSSLVPGLETQGNRVVVNLDMETNLPGLYAAGDLTGQPYQYIKAAGQGNVAALSAVKYLASKK